MATYVFADAGTAKVTAGGTTAPAPGTVETWTVNALDCPVLAAGQVFPVIDQADPSVQPEVILVTALAANGAGVSMTVTRGAEGTVPVAHRARFTVRPTVTASMLAAFAQTAALGSASTHSASDFDAAGLAAAAAAASVPKSTFTTKGDLLAGTGAAALARLAVGADYMQLLADSSRSTGLRWSTSSEAVARALGWTIATDPAVGADPTGVVDCTAVSQAALTAMGNVGKPIYYPAGSYKVSDTLLAASIRGLRIQGAGQDATYFNATAAMAGKPVFLLQDYYANTVSGLTVKGVSGSEPSSAIQSHRAVAVPAAGAGFLCQLLSVDNCRFEQVQRGIAWTSMGGATDGNNDQAQITNVHVKNFTVAAYDITHLNSLWHRFIGGKIDGGPIGWQLAGGSFVAVGVTIFVSDTEVNVLDGTYTTPFFLDGCQSECHAAIVRTSATPGIRGVWNNYSHVSSAPNLTVIDWNGTSNSAFVMSNSACDFGQAGQLAQFTSSASRASFIGNRGMGITTYSYAGVLNMHNNVHIPGTVTLTPVGSASLTQIGDSGGGFSPTTLTTKVGTVASLNVPDDVTAGKMHLFGAHPALFMGNGLETQDIGIYLSNATGGAKSGLIEWQTAGAGKWRLYKIEGDERLFFRDLVNAKMQMTMTAGAGAGAGTTAFDSAVTATGLLTASGGLAMAAQKITGLANGTAASDAAAFGQLPTALPPSGSAGGDLAGSYPNPTVAAGAVTLAKMANLAANSIIGNNTGGAATPIALTMAQVLAALSGAAGADFSLNSHKITALANGSAASDAAAFGQIPTALPPNGAAGGDLAGTYPSPTIAAAAVTLAKQANLAANSLMGNNTGSAATPLALTVAQVAALLAGITSSTLMAGNDARVLTKPSVRVITTGRYYGPGPHIPSTGAQGTNVLTCIPMWLPAPLTAVTIEVEITVVAASSTIRLGIFNNDATTDMPSTVLLDAGTVDSTATGGVRVAAITISQALTAGLWWLGAVAQGGNPTVRTLGSTGLFPVVATSFAGSSASAAMNCYFQTAVSGALATFAGTSAGSSGTKVMVKAG